MGLDSHRPFPDTQSYIFAHQVQTVRYSGSYDAICRAGSRRGHARTGGFDFLQVLDDPFQRAIFMMILVNEVHPFADSNGRVGRIMINAELVAVGEERIIIPTAYRIAYVGALKAFSQSDHADPLIRMLDAAQACAHSIDWTSMATAQAQLTATTPLPKARTPSSS